jgi:predicted Zn-dependent protease
MGNRLTNFNWEFNLIEDNKTTNAWFTPGGEIVFYTGVLPISRDEEGATVVMGHEIAHALANHGSERMSQMLLAQLGAVTLAKALRKEKETTHQLWLIAFGLDSQIGVLLPCSRAHEYEADRIGLVLMAKTGCHPSAAVDFWSRMLEISDKTLFDILSTHPATKNRARDLKGLMPEALQFYAA